MRKRKEDGIFQWKEVLNFNMVYAFKGRGALALHTYAAGVREPVKISAEKIVARQRGKVF